MSESLPELFAPESLKTFKLISGEEIVGLIENNDSDKFIIKYPAQLQNYFEKHKNNEYIEYVKLTNYLGNSKNYKAELYKHAIMCIAEPSAELLKMYEIYFVTIQSNPKGIQNTTNTSGTADNGLQLLNDLFNNDEFVNFVNDLIDTYDGVEILEIFDDEDEENNKDEALEGDMSSSAEIAPEPQPKKKKRKRVKPEGNKLPYKPEANPNTPEGWSDNPEDYI
jgi:hypothetical protein